MRLVHHKYWANFFSLNTQDWISEELTKNMSATEGLDWKLTFGIVVQSIWLDRTPTLSKDNSSEVDLVMSILCKSSDVTQACRQLLAEDKQVLNDRDK